MKSFFKMFLDSAKNFKDLRAITTASMLLAMAIAIRTLSIEITPDLRVGFTFVPIAAIAMLYGPVICGVSSFLLDFLGYIITNKSARFYSPQLALVVILSGILYGVLLYKCDFQKAKIKSCILIRAFKCNQAIKNSIDLRRFSIETGPQKSFTNHNIILLILTPQAGLQNKTLCFPALT